MTSIALLIVNLGLMMFVAFLPFSTEVLARYSWGSSSAGASTAAELYSVNVLLIGLALTGPWIYRSFHASLFGGEVRRGALNRTILRSTPSIAYALTVVLACVNVTSCYAVWVLATLYVAFGPAARKIPAWTGGVASRDEANCGSVAEGT